MIALPSILCCYLCGSPPAYLVAFVPREPWNYCAAPPVPRKSRAIFYGVCSSCEAEHGKAGVAEIVEAQLAQEVAP